MKKLIFTLVMGFSFFGLFAQANRSKKAARILAGKGYEVVELGSGFKGWVAAGKKIAK